MVEEFWAFKGQKCRLLIYGIYICIYNKAEVGPQLSPDPCAPRTSNFAWVMTMLGLNVLPKKPSSRLYGS